MNSKHDLLDHLHMHGIDFRSRRVFLYSPVYTSLEDWTPGDADFVVRNLLFLDRTQGDIELWINTPGGSVDEMWAIYDAMRVADNAIHAVAFGNVSSAGCLLLAGATGTRYATPFCSFMWHGGSEGALWISPHEFQDRAAWYKREFERWIDAMARHTKPPGCRSLESRRDFWREHARARELWLDAEGMRRHGIVDSIWGEEEED